MPNIFSENNKPHDGELVEITNISKNDFLKALALYEAHHYTNRQNINTMAEPRSPKPLIDPHKDLPSQKFYVSPDGRQVFFDKREHDAKYGSGFVQSVANRTYYDLRLITDHRPEVLGVGI